MTLPPSKKALGCKWVFYIKLKLDGTVNQCKAHLFILGNTQIEGEDVIETFAPVAKLVIVFTLLAIVIAK